ncbi:MAG: hypothetical protein ACRD1T_07615, partial [Acidimicrobiia bacterium]
MPARRRVRILGALLATLVLAPIGATSALAGGGQETPHPTKDMLQLPAAINELLATNKADGLPGLPAQPTESLIAVTNNFSQALGIEQDTTNAIRSAEFSPAVAGRLALTLEALLACHEISSDAMATLPSRELLALSRGERQPSDSLTSGLQGCTPSVLDSATELQSALNEQGDGATGPCSSPVAIWPIFHIKCHEFNAEIRNDYVLIVDHLGGDDLYANNAGGNLIDVKRDPNSGPAKGC